MGPTLNRKKLALLAHALKDSGFYVRRHAYEYIIGYGGTILGVMEVLSSSFTLYFNAEVKGEFWKVFRKLVGIIRNFDPNATVIAKLSS